uniref:Uncharacterized protein n=1 Tax=Daucus carota subsp. sativus TaxID=79200 RepID=A0A166DCH3_DAUCS
MNIIIKISSFHVYRGKLDNYQQLKYPKNSAGPTPGKTVLRIEKVKTRKVSGIFKLG